MKTLLVSITNSSAILVTMLMMAVAVPQAAHAERLTGDGRAWARMLKQSTNLSLQQIDPSGNVLPVDIHNRIVRIAQEQADGWADTILEGDYVSESLIDVEQIEVVRESGQFVGYRVTYSAAAYDVSECDAGKDLSLCRAGRIQEASYISPALESWIRDHKAYAQFVEN
jgi:hypothetical protein